MSPLLKKVQDAVAHLKAQGASRSQIGAFIRELLYSPLLEAAVEATPTPIDDMILGALKLLYPPATP